MESVIEDREWDLLLEPPDYSFGFLELASTSRASQHTRDSTYTESYPFFPINVEAMSEEAIEKRLNCPLNCHDLEQHQEERLYNEPEFLDREEMKHHIERAHVQPLWCPSCQVEVGSRKDLFSHSSTLRHEKKITQDYGSNDEERTRLRRSLAMNLRLDDIEDGWQFLGRSSSPRQTRFFCPFDSSPMDILYRARSEPDLKTPPLNESRQDRSSAFLDVVESAVLESEVSSLHKLQDTVEDTFQNPLEGSASSRSSRCTSVAHSPSSPTDFVFDWSAFNIDGSDVRQMEKQLVDLTTSGNEMTWIEELLVQALDSLRLEWSRTFTEIPVNYPAKASSPEDGELESSSSSRQPSRSSHRRKRQKCEMNAINEAPDEQNAEDDDSGEEDERRKHKKDHKYHLEHLKLRCPFFSKDPVKYGAFSACSSGRGFPSISTLMQHLKRKHLEPLRCPRCLEAMRSEADLERHQRVPRANMCEVLPQPKDNLISRSKWPALQRISMSNDPKSVEQKWTLLYQALFNSQTPVPSPYEKPIMLHQLEPFLLEALQEVLSEKLQPYIPNVFAEIQGTLPMIIQICRDRLRSAVAGTSALCNSENTSPVRTPGTRAGSNASFEADIMNFESGDLMTNALLNHGDFIIPIGPGNTGASSEQMQCSPKLTDRNRCTDSMLVDNTHHTHETTNNTSQDPSLLEEEHKSHSNFYSNTSRWEREQVLSVPGKGKEATRSPLPEVTSIDYSHDFDLTTNMTHLSNIDPTCTRSRVNPPMCEPCQNAQYNSICPSYPICSVQSEQLTSTLHYSSANGPELRPFSSKGEYGREPGYYAPQSTFDLNMDDWLVDLEDSGPHGEV